LAFLLLGTVMALFLTVNLAAQRPAQIKLFENMTITIPPEWRVGNQTRDSLAIHVPLKQERGAKISQDKENPKPEVVVSSEAGMTITIEHRRDHAEAVRRLAEIASEYAEPVATRLIDGWPAIERRYRSLMPQPGTQERSVSIQTSFATTAIAVASTVIRFETMLAPDGDPKWLEDALSIAHGLRAPEGDSKNSTRELEDIKRMTKPPKPAPQSPPARSAPVAKGNVVGSKGAGVAVQVQSGLGELEVASNDGQNVVVAANSGFSFSSNFGGTYTFGGGTPCTQPACDGDPSLAVGNSGNIYYAWIGGPTGSSLGDGVSRSTNNGQTFTFRGMAATCPGTTACTLADQEHIAADRNNAASGGGDRLYNVWRDFGGSFSIRISCSTDSGATWTPGTAIGAGDLPRVSVGGDGFVYAAWPSGANMMLHKFSNCDAGLTPQVGWPITVSAFTNVVCPVAGLDRCNGRNILSSQKVAVDDLDPTHIYYAFATSTGAGNEDIMVFDSTDGGATFPRSVRVNNAVVGRRFMPWISTYGGSAVLSWYDRRTATAGNNDLTRFFIGGATVRGPNLVALAETDLSGNNDAQCSTWPCATNASTDSEGCSIQPELGGRCQTTTGTGSQTPCDFSSTVCPTGETCRIGRGCPKYGDYNGNAAALGRHFSAWSSALPPTSVGGAAGAIKVYASADRIPSDFYVRDWNDTPTLFDNGAQPSTHSVFWATSDVWNQSTNVAAAPGPDGSVLGDPPSRSGSNFVYARVSRRAPAMSAAPAAVVTVNFLMGDYGLGVPFAAIGSETLTFNAGDMTKITPAHAWTVPVSASGHLCIAAEISGPDGDTFVLPSVGGTAVGVADPMIIIDNDKAQRNLQDTIGTGSGTELIAEIRNRRAVKRLMELTVRLPPEVKVRAIVDVVGGRSTELTTNGRVIVGDLAPGETRWVRFRFTSLSDKPIPIDIFEDTNPPTGGFTILLRRRGLEEVAARNLLSFGGMLYRLAQIENNGKAKELAALAVRTAVKVSKENFTVYLAANQAAFRDIFSSHLRYAKGTDPFDGNGALKDLALAIDRKNADQMALATTELTERLDAHLTMIMRQRGYLR